MNDLYLYSTKLYSNPLKLTGKALGKQEIPVEQAPINDVVETIILRDLKMAYGMLYEVEFLSKFTRLKTFVLEINDLRGSDRHTFPKLILDITVALGQLSLLECIEVGQKPGHTSCTFDDNDIEAE